MKNGYRLKDGLISYRNLHLDYKLPICLGIDEIGKEHFADLADLGHVLLAGATGSGKTVFGNSIIISLMSFLKPYEIKFLLVDMKQVELGVFKDSPYLLTDPLVNPEGVFNQLELLGREVEARLWKLELGGVETIEELRLKYPKGNFPYILVLIDTFSDLILNYRERFEAIMERLASSALKVGVHIVMCDSRVGDDEFTPHIRSLFPTKICFKVCDADASSLILNTSGAENLLGRGDLLLLEKDQQTPIHLQAPLISDKEIEEITEQHRKMKSGNYPLYKQWLKRLFLG